MRQRLVGLGLGIALVFGVLFSQAALSQGSLSWESSPLNFQNSPLNFDNSSLNFQNSPLNFENSPLNFNSGNGVYDNRGNRVGYGVTAPSGVTNFFDNSGNRIGYKPKN
jgi:hypothetical protein